MQLTYIFVQIFPKNVKRFRLCYAMLTSVIQTNKNIKKMAAKFSTCKPTLCMYRNAYTQKYEHVD